MHKPKYNYRDNNFPLNNNKVFWVVFVVLDGFVFFGFCGFVLVLCVWFFVVCFFNDVYNK